METDSTLGGPGMETQSKCMLHVQTYIHVHDCTLHVQKIYCPQHVHVHVVYMYLMLTALGSESLEADQNSRQRSLGSF